MAEKHQNYAYDASDQTVTQQPDKANVAYTAQPIQQPVVQLMPIPASMPGVPQGLEYLTQLDQLLVHQLVEVLELVTGWETCNKYEIKNSLGQKVYFAREESGCCMRQCCGPARGFILHIEDNYQQEVMRLIREFKCCAGCCWCANSECCQMEIVIEAPVGQPVGYVRQQYSKCPPKFVVQDATEQPIFMIDGPVCLCRCVCCPSDINFHVSSYEGGVEVGKITKQWAGAVRELFTDADYFGVTFPRDLDVRMKAVLLGALFLIDFMYFEQQQNSN